jgi:hypothetical protein
MIKSLYSCHCIDQGPCLSESNDVPRISLSEHIRFISSVVENPSGIGKPSSDIVESCRVGEFQGVTVCVFKFAEANFRGKVHFGGLYKYSRYFEFAEVTAENHEFALTTQVKK